MSLNVDLLVSCILIAFVSVLYIFYWNRFFGLVLSLIARLTLWGQSSTAVWVDFGSIHLSLLSGKLLLRNFRYHSSNQTLRVVKCQISWRYWIRHAAEEEDLADELLRGERDSETSLKRPPGCRIHISLEGLEWFMYNRTAAFENVLAQLGATDQGNRTKSRESNVRSEQIRNPQASTHTLGRRALSVIRFPSFIARLYAWIQRQLPDLDPKSLLPVSLEVLKGAITMGNHTTENLLMAQFASASGTYGIVQSRSEHDLHKQLLHIHFTNAVLNCVENPDYWAPMRRIGSEVHDILPSRLFTFRDFNNLWQRVRSAFSYFKPRQRRYVNPERDGKKKARKAEEEESHIGVDFTKLEYAMDRKLLETPSMEVTYYADVAGEVPEDPQKTDAKGIEFLDIGNGDLPPEWGVDIVTYGASVHYGPWADRQRVQLQRAFFPPMFQHSTPSEPLEPGDLRKCTCMKVFFEFRGVTTVHVPFREASKNWQWDGVVEVLRDRKMREAASLQFRLGDNTSLKYLVPMVATSDGYCAELHTFLDNVALTSSLNEIHLLDAASCTISSNLPSPLRWDAERSWVFNMILDRPVLYLIRDHINMLTDLGKDWASGPPSDFTTFIPMIYGININFNDFELNFYANDHNIIDRPLDRRENVLFTYKANTLESNVLIPLNKFRPYNTTVSFEVNVPDLTLLLTLPRWNTHTLSSRMADEKLSCVAHLPNFRIDGSYLYYAEVREDCADQLKLNIQGKSPAFKLYGCVVRHFMAWRENYFGSFTQYSTTREYLEKRDKGISVGDPLELKYRPGKNNMFHLDLTVVVEDGLVALPAGAPGYERGPAKDEVNHSERDSDIGACVAIAVPLLQVHMRLHEFFMDLSINFDPVSASIESSYSDSKLLSHAFIPSREQLCISGIDITANRLFGPAPRNTAYVCIWNIHIGHIKGSFAIEESTVLLHSGRSFMIGYSDPFNAPAAEYTAVDDRDATFLKVNIDFVDAVIPFTTVAMRAVLSQGLQLFFNNIAGISYRKLTSIIAPQLELQLLYSPNTSRQWLEVMRAKCSVSLDMYKSPSGWRHDAELQRRFLDAQDATTNRFKNMFGRGYSAFDRWHSSLRLLEVMAPMIKSNGYQGAKTPSRLLSPRKQTGRLRNRREQADFSDSEQEPISEMDRDRRLANSRPSSCAIYNNGSNIESASSLHESDETNDSDTESFWSDYLEPNEDAKFTLEGYLAFCRRFELYHRASEGLCGNEFKVTQEPHVPRLETSYIDDDYHEDTRVSHTSNEHDLSDKRNRTNLRMKVDYAELILTGLASSAAVEIFVALRNESWSPELKLDGFMLDSLPTSTSDSDFVYDVNISKFFLRFVQDLLPVGEMLEVSNTFPGMSSAGYSARIMAILEVELTGLRAIADYTPRDTAGLNTVSPSGTVTIQNISCSLATQICSALNAAKSYSPDVVVHWETDKLSLSFSTLRAECSLGSMTVRIHPHTPETVIIAARALQSELKELIMARKNYIGYTRAKFRHLVLLVFDCSRDRHSNDVFAAIQPSFLVQSGRPQKLRQDANWKLLFHLRHILADMSESTSQDLDAKLAAGPGSLDIYRALKKYNIPWAAEEGLTVMGLDVVRSLFDEPKSNAFRHMHRNDTLPTRSAEFRCGSLNVVFAGHGTGSQNSIMIGGIELRVDLLSRRMIIVPHTISSHSATYRSAVHNDPVDYGNMTLLVTLSINSVQLTIFPTILTFLQNAIHVSSVLSLSAPAEINSTSDEPASTFLGIRLGDRIISCDARIALRHLLLEAAAENLIFEVISRDFSSTTVCYFSRPSSGLKASLDTSVNHGLGFEEITLRARTRLFSEARYRENDVLAKLSINNGLMCSLYQNHAAQGPAARSSVHVNALELSVPRSALRLYHFAEQWRQDYLLGIDAMMKSLFSEIRQKPKRPAQRNVQRNKTPLIYDFNASLSTLAIDLQVMHGTWLLWSAHEVIAYGKNPLSQEKVVDLYGLQVGSQKVAIASGAHSRSGKRGDEFSEIAFGLPEFCISATSGAGQSSLLATMGFLEMTIKPSHWDALLSVQQKFGQDFNDLLLIIGERGRKRVKPCRQTSAFPFNVLGKFEGFKIGLEGLSSTQYLQCDNIDAVYSVSSQRQWQISLADLALYLSPKRRIERINGHDLPLSVSVDLRISSFRPSASDGAQSCLDIAISKLYAVFQASMMGEIGDFVDYLQAEVLLREEQRALELNDFKEKAKKVMQTFNVKPRQPNLADTSGFFSERIVRLSVKNIVAAFPLQLSTHTTGQEGLGNSARAFMACIDTLSFQTQRGESGDALMTGFCFQFVSRFNATSYLDFRAKKHQSMNKLFYPTMTAKMSSDTSRTTRKIFIAAEISGFVLDLDPAITAYAFAVIDVFRQGKQRVEKLAAGFPRATSELGDPVRPETENRNSTERKASSLSTEIHGSLKFKSGSICLHATPMREMPEYSSLATDWIGRTYQIFDPDVERFDLPELSVQCDYLARASDLPEVDDDSPARVLMFKFTVHSSSNTLRPSLLPFITEIVHNIEERMRASSTEGVDLRPPSARELHSVPSFEGSLRTVTRRSHRDKSGLQIIFSLRIDKSQLELTCKPDVNVVARLNWESGGFLLNISPGPKGVSVSASISGLTAGLRHGFLSEDSLNINAKNLIFSVNFSKSTLANAQQVNSVSVVVETEVAGSIRFTRLQDFLCFKAVWLDHIPIFKGDAIGKSKSKATSRMSLASPIEDTQKQGIDTAIVVRIRQIKLEADLGQSITTVTLELQSTTVRARITDEISELAVSVDRVATQARGNLSGHLRMPDFLFRTLRKRQDVLVDKQPLGRMLELFLTSGTLDIQLQSDWLWLLQYRAEPFQAMVYDDWPTTNVEEPVKDRQLQLSFTVSGSKVVAMLTVMAIPKLVTYAGKFMENLEAQREGASRESSAFRSARLPRPDNALSEVANAMLQTARTKLKESETLSYIIAQRMSLNLKELVFVLLPRQGDHELARFIGRDIMAQLKRTVRPDGSPVNRDLTLSLTHMSISQLIKQGFDPSLPGQEFDVLTGSGRRFGGVENVIFSLPAMDMRMISDDEVTDGLKTLLYDFDSNFVRLEGQEKLENISISFNLSLYSWLTVLRKTFTRELKRAQEVAEWRAGNPSSPVLTSTVPRFESPPTRPTPLVIDGAPSPVRSKSLENVFVPLPQARRISATKSTSLLPSPRIVSPELPKASFRLSEPGFTTAPTSPESKGASPADKDPAATPAPAPAAVKKSSDITYKVRKRKIERLTVRQLGEATPDVMHPFFTRKAGFNLEESLPQYVHEYATLPIEEIMKALLKIYSKQLKIGR